MRTEPLGGGGAFWPLQLWATPPRASADSCPGPGFGDSPDGILDGPYLPSFIPPSSLPVKCELRPLDTNLQPEQGEKAAGAKAPASLQEREPRAWGKALPPVSQAPGGCLLDPHPRLFLSLWLIHLDSPGSCGTDSLWLK